MSPRINKPGCPTIAQDEAEHNYFSFTDIFSGFYWAGSFDFVDHDHVCVKELDFGTKFIDVFQ